MFIKCTLYSLHLLVFSVLAGVFPIISNSTDHIVQGDPLEIFFNFLLYLIAILKYCSGNCKVILMMGMEQNGLKK